MIPRIELPCLRGIRDRDERFFLSRYLRSNVERDLDIARERCARYGIDFETARDEARRMT